MPDALAMSQTRRFLSMTLSKLLVAANIVKTALIASLPRGLI
jgi:hypothetical protein